MKKKTEKDSGTQEILIENFVNLQKVLTNLAVKFEELSSNISKLLQIFEISAKNFAEKYSEKEMKKGESEKREIKPVKTSPEINQDFKDLVNKLNALLEQNKTIARGILLIEERIRNQLGTPTFGRVSGQVTPSPYSYQQPPQSNLPSPPISEEQKEERKPSF